MKGKPRLAHLSKHLDSPQSSVSFPASQRPEENPRPFCFVEAPRFERDKGTVNQFHLESLP